MAHSHQSMYVATFVVLLALLGATVGAAFLPIGHASIYVALAIACTKAFLILYLFMHLRDETGLVRVAAVLGFLWLGHLLVFTMSDYMTRKDVLPGPAATATSLK